MSPYHFLRVFHRGGRHDAASVHPAPASPTGRGQLRRSSKPVLDVALDAGFADLSTFNRRFRATMGMTPSAYRRRGRAMS